jgi:predicted nucleic acid-binding protein
VLDTNVVIFLLKSESDRKRFTGADLFISVITEIELFAKSGMTTDEEEKILSFLDNSVAIVDLSPDIKKQTIALRRSAKIKLPDCIIAATAIVLDATLVTHDTDDLLPLVYPGYKAQDIF